MAGPHFRDYAVSPGWSGVTLSNSRLQVYVLASGTALGSTTFPAVLGAGGGLPTSIAWLTFTCDNGAGLSVPFYLNTNSGSSAQAAAPADPDPTEDGTGTPGARCLFIPAGFPYTRRFRQDQSFNALQTSGSDAYLRVEMTTELGS